jgi:hypothetical protein
MNGYPAVRFTFSDVLETPVEAGTALSGDPAFSLFFVGNLQNRQAQHKHPLTWSSGGVAGGVGSAIEIDGQNLDWATGFGADANGIDLVNLGEPSYAPHFDKPAIISFRRDAPGPINNVEMAINGVPLLVEGSSTNPNISPAPVRINAYPPDSSFTPMDMDVAEVIIYDRKLDASEHDQIIDYLERYLTPRPVTIDTDFNDSNATDIADFHILRSNFLLTGRTHSQGDANSDNIVNHNDFFLWRTAFLGSGGNAAAIDWSPVPEPSALVLVLSCSLTVLCRRRTPRRIHK